MSKIINGAAIGVMGLAAAAIAAAPIASADTTTNNLTVVGSQYVVGQTYTLAGNVFIGGATAQFYDNGNLIGSVTTQLLQGSLGNVPVTLQWSPTTAGQHVITEKNVDGLTGTQTLSTNGPVTVTVITQWNSIVGSIPGIGPVLGSLS